MKSTIIIGTLGICALAATLASGALPGQAKTVAQGVYTSAQADRGAQVIVNWGCQNCHGRSLEGGLDEQPQLVGEEFIGAWTGRDLDELVTKITTMPADQDEQYHVKRTAAPDVVAFLLRANGYPEGKAELPSDAATLKLIQIVAP